jgi:hypothetical protein
LRKLRENGRVTSVADLLSNTNSGTLIVDRPGVNLKATHCWWTNENVADLSPVPIPADDERLGHCMETRGAIPHEFDVWCWQRYISPLTGSAKLVSPPRHGKAMAAKVREQLPDLDYVRSWSAIPAMQSLAAITTEPGDEPGSR